MLRSRARRSGVRPQRQLLQLVELCDVAYVALHDGAHVIACPCLRACGQRAGQHFRVSAQQDALFKGGVACVIRGLRRLACEQSWQQAGRLAVQFGLGKRQEFRDFHAPRQAVGNAGQ